MEKEKQEKILDGAFKEFANYGYKKTSMDQVAKAGGISKSMVFHYFGKKSDLYSYLVYKASSIQLEYFSRYLENIASLDYLDRYILSAKIKGRLLLEEEFAFKFISKVYLSQEEVSLANWAQEKYQDLLSFAKDSMEKIQDLAQGENFIDTIDSQRVQKYIFWIIEGFSQEIENKYKNLPLGEEKFQEDWQKMDQITQDLRKLFYKESKDENN